MFKLRDVARLADVSVATASAVMNGKGTVSEKLRKRVEAAVEALDYQPDHVARSLAVRATHTIGMLIPDITNPFFTAVMQGVEEEARQSRYWVIYCNANRDWELERHYMSSLFARRVDGVILAPTNPNIALDRLSRRRIPLVLFDRIPQGFSGAAVVTDNFGASRAAGRYLIELGHKRIAIINGRLDVSNGLERLEGFRQALQEADLPLADEYCQRGDFSIKGGYQCGLHLMRLPHPPTAIFCCNDTMTLGLMRALAELRIPCPDCVSVLGFDDFEWAASFSPRLSTIAQPAYEIGRRATGLLLRMLKRNKQEGEQEKDEVIVLQNELRIRDSTAPPATIDVAQSA